MIFGSGDETGRYILQLTQRFTCRLASCESLLAHAREEGYGTVLMISEGERALFQALVTSLGVRAGDCRLLSADPAETDSPADVLEGALAELSRGVPGRRNDTRPVCAFVDLGPALGSMNAAADAVRLIDAIAEIQRRMESIIVCSVSPTSVPRGAGLEFCLPHDQWVCDSFSIRELLSGEHVATAITTLTLGEPEARLATLQQARDGVPVRFPRLEHSYRRGFLILDTELDIRFASGQLQSLLGRAAGDLVDRPLSICLDGVDLATVRRETDLAVRGAPSSPFITSWRLAPGRYEPREVTVDLIARENRTVGFLLSVGVSETVRGPRTVYRDAREELALADFVDDDDTASMDEAINALESTQITRREHEVLLLILQGKANKEIARHLNIAEVTVKKHLTSVYRKLRINNRKELLQSFSVPGSSYPEKG